MGEKLLSCLFFEAVFVEIFLKEFSNARPDEAFAIWMRKIQMLKQISGINEFHSPLPLLSSTSSSGTDSWLEPLSGRCK